MQSAIAIAQELRENRDAECLKGTYEVYRKAAKAYFYDEKKGLLSAEKIDRFLMQVRSG